MDANAKMSESAFEYKDNLTYDTMKNDISHEINQVCLINNVCMFFLQK